MFVVDPAAENEEVSFTRLGCTRSRARRYRAKGVGIRRLHMACTCDSIMTRVSGSQLPIITTTGTRKVRTSLAGA